MNTDKLMKEFYKIELKPCPFCGREPTFEANRNRIICHEDGYCGVSPVTGSYGKWSDLIKDWNTRK